MGDERLCATCPVLHPNGRPRYVQWPLCCESCRPRIRAELTEITDLYALLPTTQKAARGPGDKVSGSKDPPIPARIDVVDLSLPVRPAQRQLFARGVLGIDPDQIGDLSVATFLDTWVRDWAGIRQEHLPPPLVTDMVQWLLNRLDWAMDEHLAIDEFASEVNEYVRTLRQATRTDTYRGEMVGKCPAKLRDDTRCNATLRCDPYLDRITCGRCSSSWNRRDAGWTQLRAQQDEWERPNEEEAA